MSDIKVSGKVGSWKKKKKRKKNNIILFLNLKKCGKKKINIFFCINLKLLLFLSEYISFIYTLYVILW